MIKFNFRLFPRRFFTSMLALLLGLYLGFLMDYFHGRKFGMVLLVIDLTDSQKYTALVVSLCAFLFFRKKRRRIPPNAGLFALHHFTTFTSLLITAFILYCSLPSNIRNASFKYGMTSFLSQHPEESAILRKLLVEKKPDPEEALPYESAYPGIGDSLRSRIHVLSIVYSEHCNTLIIHGHFRYIVAVFLDSVDEATAKEIIAHDVYRLSAFKGRPLFSVKAFGLTLVWEDIAKK